MTTQIAKGEPSAFTRAAATRLAQRRFLYQLAAQDVQAGAGTPYLTASLLREQRDAWCASFTDLELEEISRRVHAAFRSRKAVGDA